jgi:hypothetical protein
MERSKHPDGEKHHYIPVFYLKQWAGPDGRLCEFSRKHEQVTRRLTSPVGTGYARGLNTFTALPPAIANFLEETFFQQADDKAAKAFHLMLDGGKFLSGETKSAWSRFLLTLIYRTPEGMRRVGDRILAVVPTTLDSLAAQYDSLRGDNDPIAFEEFRSTVPDDQIIQAAHQRVLTKLMDNARIGQILNSMIFAVLLPNNLSFPLLTSDRPMTMTNGLGQPDACVIMPITPTKIFVAAKNEGLINRLADSIKVKDINDTVVRQARDYVYSSKDDQLQFIRNRLGERARWCPFE